MAAAVDVSVEAVTENQIQEITLDGQEIYVQPLSMSENLTKLAHKIDFSKDESEEKGKPTSEGEQIQEEEKTVAPFQPSLWPWDSVRTKLKQALTEMSVLLDVVNISKKTQYMVTEAVSQDNQETKSAIFLVGKKKAFGSAATILLNGAERLRKSHMESPAKRSSPDFHSELHTLRQNWRLKRVRNTILGDLSYKSAGSRFWISGAFEVKKSDPDATDIVESPSTHLSVRQKNTIEVVIPSELAGFAYIQVVIKKLGETVDLATAEMKMPSTSGSIPSIAHSQRKLEAAQNVIFCKELFAQLAREAVQLKTTIPHMVVGNQIFSHLFPGVQLSVALCHYTDKERKLPASPPNTQSPDHNPVLEHSLHQLLREVHHKNLFNPRPHPVTALLGVSKRRRLAGPHALSKDKLIDMMESETLLEQIIKQARHIVMRERAISVIDDLAVQIPDPQITAHWSNVSSACESQIKINIMSAGYESIRTPVVLHLGVDTMKAVCKDGRVIHLSYEEQELRDLLLCQIASHHITTLLSCVSKHMGWTTLSINTHVGVGEMEPVGNAQAIVMASPSGNRLLSIRSGPVSGVRVYMQVFPGKEDNSDSPYTVVNDPKWSFLGGPWKEVHLDRIDGKNLMNKIELLMASLTTR